VHLGVTPFRGRHFGVPLEDAIHINYLLLLVLLQQRNAVHETLWHEQLHQGSPDHTGTAYEDALQVLTKAERDQLEGLASELHDEDLAEEYRDNDHDEEVVVKEIGEDVDFLLLELAGIEKVENLQKDENIEEDREMFSVLLVPVILGDSDETFHAEDLVSLEEDDGQHEDLVEAVEDDSAPHLGSNDMFFPFVGHSLQQIVGRRLGRQS
jgi:hypothetical protein